ncbi:hypothetical protein O181_043242 [Austropuccinia psidii MF-1]|uniref:Uncharacterized protein n=1 Tax=Austropuccinia psidii MF-1 TaxID=1389203 RepID=A0A9Q3DK57_9BASI|nr:hypothetical protein [Austropuccinia psidii MF-1]
MSTLNFSKLKGPKKMKDSFVTLFTITRLIRNNVVEVKLSEGFSRKHPMFPVSLIKTYNQTGEDNFPSRNKTHHPSDKVELEDYPSPVKKIIKARKIRINGKNYRQYLVRFKDQTADKNKWLAGNFIPDGYLHLRRFGASRRPNILIKDKPFLERGYVSL